MVVTVPLTKGHTAIIDRDMLGRVLCYSWSYRRDGYAVAQIGEGKERKLTAMHRYIYSLVNGPIPTKMVIDHINGNKLDNRIENLRCIMKKENMNNQRGHREKLYTYKVNGKGKYRAAIWFKGKTYHIGMFDTLEAALEAKKTKLLELERDYKKTCKVPYKREAPLPGVDSGACLRVVYSLFTVQGPVPLPVS
jgi:hypothetical protein